MDPTDFWRNADATPNSDDLDNTSILQGFNKCGLSMTLDVPISPGAN